MSIRHRLAALAGLAGPAVFTSSWVASTLRQHEYSVVEEHLSGLAAPDARNRHLMTTGFLAMGGCTLVFARELEATLGGPERAGLGPSVLTLSGWATIVAGLLPRDRMALRVPGESLPPIPSWKNDGHDIASGVIYGCVVVGPLVMAWRFRDDPEWRDLVAPSVAVSAVSVALLALFASRVVEPYNGIVQRLMVSVPMVSTAMLAARVLRQGQRSEARRQ